jgi:hypothetical protein
MSIDLGKLAETLKASGALTNYSGRAAPIEHELAYDLGDIIQSMQLVITTHWPQLMASSSADIAAEALDGIREELRHILYHIKDSAFLSLIEEQSDA